MEKDNSEDYSNIPDIVNLEFKLIPEDLFDIYVAVEEKEEEEDPGMKLTTMKKSLIAKISKSDVQHLPELVKYKIKGTFGNRDESDGEEEDKRVIVKN